MRIVLLILPMLAGTAAMAETPFLPPVPITDARVVDYRCHAGKSLQVAYYNQRGGQSFARMTVKNEALLFVDTIAASGVKYVAGPYAWWTKGEHGDLYDMTAGPNAAPLIAGCSAMPGK
ncbi:hypothetical protein HY57_04785 [Dyella japonica A8]|uniref:C-type lysozyme inhibitor domain-containing protein n=2 Tax=Dyella japonica TaxID=231455 RepID=A0A075K389_9GAMM|nr:hypothetical protein HY57_04785 [Dyella japonica A8]